MKSDEYEHLLKFLNEVYADEENVEFTNAQIKHFFNRIQNKKTVLDLTKEQVLQT